MKRIHVISVGEPHMCDVAISIKRKGNIVSCSGVDINGSENERLAEYEILPSEQGWRPEMLVKDLDFVLVPNLIDENNPELVRAKELGLLVLSFSEFMFAKFKDKSRVLVCGKENRGDVLKMMLYSLSKNNHLLDYVISDSITGMPTVSWGYDARMAILEEDNTISPFINRPLNEYYRPHILILSDMKWVESDAYPTRELYIDSLKKLILSVEREGKIIYKDVPAERDEMLMKEVLSVVREDLTAMPFTVHQVKETDNGVSLDSRFGEYNVECYDYDFLRNLNAARIACRQVGLQDRGFYEAMSEYSGIR